MCGWISGRLGADLADRRHLPLNQARLRPHLRDRAELVGHQAVSAAGGIGRSAPRNGWKTPVGDDRERLRGLPALSKGGMSSAVPGTDPEAALLEKERRF